MKNKYQRLDRAGRKAAVAEFKDYDSTHDNIFYTLDKLKWVGIVAIAFGVLAFISDIFVYKSGVFILILYAVTALFGIFFVYQSRAMLGRQVNKYLINKDNEVKKKKKVEEENK